jgi:hypothetical protein
MRIRRANYASVAVLSVALIVSSSSITSATTPDGVTAQYRGQEIALGEVASHHCHDLAYPVIQCFDSAAERDLDLIVESVVVTTSRLLGPEPEPPTPYVTWYAATNYGGSSFTASQSYADLGVLSWNDSISSFKSLNGGRPKWWQGTNYTSTSWRWLAGAQVSYVGDPANDQFSSVQNVP